LINLQQDAEGFIRMNRHYPESILVSVTFSNGSVEEVSGKRLNQAYDDALAEFRAQNHLDGKDSRVTRRAGATPATRSISCASSPAWVTEPGRVAVINSSVPP
jgi:hypothetical protein